MGILRLIKHSTLVAGGLTLLGLLGADAAGAFTLTVLHNNDGESKLTTSDTGEGGAAQFVSLVKGLQTNAGTDAVITLSSGDNFLAGTAFNASLQAGNFYDAIVLNAIGYDAISLGNHDFDFGPTILADFINSPNWTNPVPYLSANLDFSGEPALQALVNAGRIAKSTIVTKDGERIGVIGAVTEGLASISSPGLVNIGPVQAAVQAEVDALEAQGVNKIILISHLQSINEELALIPNLRGVDIVIAGGGDELLINDLNQALPSDQGSTPFGGYPQTVTDSEGKLVPVITTPGNYGYVGRLEVEFNAAGEVISANGNPIRVLAGDPGVGLDAEVQSKAVQPVLASEQALDQNVLGVSAVSLDGTRANVRTTETNYGNLIADALLWQGQQTAAAFGVDVPQIALQNGGGIRNDSVLPAGDFTEKDTFDALPFANFVSVIPNVSATVLKAVLENAVSQIENVSGRYAQIAGFKLGFDITAPPGSRVIDVILEDGTPLVLNGIVLPDAPTVDVASIDFLIRESPAGSGLGGDEYPWGGLPFTSVGVTYQQALANYVEQGLQGQITATDYPEGGEGRVFATAFDPDESLPGSGSEDPASVPEPSLILGLLAVGGLTSRALQRR
jgi:5'-nucleotidase/UDP-sugar diphosphatase